MLQNRFALLYLIRQNWKKNYRHHRGALAIARCILGTSQVKFGIAQRKLSGQKDVECITFSVVPALTAAWTLLLNDAIPVTSKRIIIGDCSGGFTFGPQIPSEVIPLLNYSHGEKLDLFFREVCSANYIIVSDDDVFWLSSVPWEWAMDRFTRDPKLAVVSLVPRQRFDWQIDATKHQPMGSYCLIIRRELWLKEQLSFRQVAQPSPNPKSFQGQYDTADFANLELIKRGYTVDIAPKEIREHLLAMKGVSSSIIHVQKYIDEPSKLIKNTRNPRKDYRSLTLLSALQTLFEEHQLITPPSMQNAYRSLLATAGSQIRTLLTASEVETVNSEVEESLARLEEPFSRIIQRQ